MDTLNERERLEASAASWAACAEMLQLKSDNPETGRRAAAAGLKAEEEAPRSAPSDDEPQEARPARR